MWTRTYLVLLLVRLYLALSPSYIHPDENFQGPEVIAGMSSKLATLQIQFSVPALGPEERLKQGRGCRPL